MVRLNVVVVAAAVVVVVRREKLLGCVNLGLERMGVLWLELLLLLLLLGWMLEGRRRVEVGVVERIPCGIFLYSTSLDYIVFGNKKWRE